MNTLQGVFCVECCVLHLNARNSFVHKILPSRSRAHVPNAADAVFTGPASVEYTDAGGSETDGGDYVPEVVKRMIARGGVVVCNFNQLFKVCSLCISFTITPQ